MSNKELKSVKIVREIIGIFTEDMTLLLERMESNDIEYAVTLR